MERNVSNETKSVRYPSKTALRSNNNQKNQLSDIIK